MQIQSTQNEKVKTWMKLHHKKGRDEARQFLVEGEHLIAEAIQKQCLDTLLIVEGMHTAFEGTVIECSEPVLKKLSQSISGTTMIGVCNMVETSLKESTRVILLDNIQDPGNLGTLIRTAHSFGFDAVYCSEDCVDLYNDKTIRSTQGAFFHIPVIRINMDDQFKELREDGFTLIGTALKRAIPFAETKDVEKIALMFGNEGQGIKDKYLEQTDVNVKIEINEFDSLNVAVAAGICMYRYRKN